MECYLALKKMVHLKNYKLRSGIVAQDYTPKTHVSEEREFWVEEWSELYNKTCLKCMCVCVYTHSYT